MPLFAALPPGLRRLRSSRSLLLSKGKSATAEASAKGEIVDDDLVEPNHIDPRMITFLTAADAACADGADFTSSQRIWSNTGGYTPGGTATDSKGQHRRYLPRFLPMPSLRCFLACFPSWCRKTTNEQDDTRQRDLLAPSPTSLPLGYSYSNQGKGTPIVAQTKPSRSFFPSFLWIKKTAKNMSGTATTITSPVTTTESGSPIEPTQQRLSLNLVRPSIDVDLSGLFDTSCAIQSSEGVPAALLPSLPSAKVRHEEVLLTSGDGLPVWASKSVLEGYEEAKDQALIFIHGLTFTSDSTWAHILSDVNFHRSLLVPASKDSTTIEAEWLVRPLIRYDLRHHGGSISSDGPSSTAAASHPISSPNLVSDFAAACTHFCIRGAYLVAWSIGGTVSTDIVAAALASQDQASATSLPVIKGLIWLCPFPWVVLTPHIIQESMYGVTAPLFERGGIQMAALESGAAPSEQDNPDENKNASIAEAKIGFVGEALRLVGEEAPTTSTDTLAQLHASSLALPVLSFFQYCTRTDNDPAPLIAAVQEGKLPLLHLHGERDASIGCDQTINALKEAFRINAEGCQEQKSQTCYEVELIKDASHALPIQQAEECLKRIVDWLGRIEGKTEQVTKEGTRDVKASKGSADSGPHTC